MTDKTITKREESLRVWSAGMRRRLEKMTPELLQQAKKEVFRKLQALKQSDGFHSASRALFAFAKKPVW